MNPNHLHALIALELRRIGPTVLRVQGAALVLAALFAVASSEPHENMLAVLLGTPIGVTLVAPMTVIRDKMEGTLEFLCSLPATAGELVTARFAAAALCILPGIALAGAGLAWLPLPAPVAAVPGELLFTALVGYWAALVVVSWLMAAAFASFEFARLMRWPLAIAVILLVVLPRVLERVVPDNFNDVMRQAVAQPWAPTAAALLVLALMGTAALVAFAITRRAFANYRPDFERPM